MPEYTTGELAALCGVTVRTVQYYDQRGILVPHALTEGGRRLYTEEDRKRLEFICFLRGLDLPIESIRELLNGEHPEKVLALLIEKQKNELGTVIREKQAKLDKLTELEKNLKTLSDPSLESIGDMAHEMENKNQLKRVRRNMLLCGIPQVLLEAAAIVLTVRTGSWRYIIGYLILSVLFAVPLVKYYYRNVAYICPECHTVFRPTVKDFTFSKHTIYTRRLTCTHCGHRGFCVETGSNELTEVKNKE